MCGFFLNKIMLSDVKADHFSLMNNVTKSRNAANSNSKTKQSGKPGCDVILELKLRNNLKQTRTRHQSSNKPENTESSGLSCGGNLQEVA